MGKLLIGMVHLPALPGAPRAALPMEAIEERARQEARLLREAGFHGCVVENYGDSPFHKNKVEPVTVAAMARVVAAIGREQPGWRLGVNVLRNDAHAAVAIAAACGASFVRVNVHVGAAATDQGVIEGGAAETLRLRRSLGASVEIWADVHVKHARPLSHAGIEREAEDAVRRGHADALLVSGPGTGAQAELEDVRRVAGLGLGVPVFVASGVTERTVTRFLEFADGVIIGTALKTNGDTQAPLDPERVRRLVAAARAGAAR
jgi:hypothetical protein